MTCSGCASPTGNWEAGWGGRRGPSLSRGQKVCPHHTPSRWPRLVRACSLEGILALPASTMGGEVSGLVTVKQAPAAADPGDVEGPWGRPLAPMGDWRLAGLGAPSLLGRSLTQDPPVSVRSSCRPFALDDLDDYEKHFTVMNYDPEVVLKQVGSLGGRYRPRPTPIGFSSGQARRP